MSISEEIRQETATMSASELMRYILLRKFPGRVLVTSSLRARSIVVLSMVSDIDASTPVVFCHPPNVYPESLEYAERIVGLLGLSDVRKLGESEVAVPRGSIDRVEHMWVDDPMGGKTHEVVHLNASLQGFECWISSVYHGRYSDEPAPRITDDGHLIRVSPLAGWTEADVREYMIMHNLPWHPRIEAKRPPPLRERLEAYPTYAY